MGATLTAMVANEEARAFVAVHVGDSPAYLFRTGSECCLRSHVATPGSNRRSRTSDGPGPGTAKPLRPPADTVPGARGAPPHPQVPSGQSAHDDTYLLCTNGLVGMLQDQRLATILSETFRAPGTAEEQCAKALSAMLEAANEASGRDNILGSNDSVRLAVSQGVETGRVMRSSTCSAATSRRSNVKTLRTRAVA